MTTNHTPELDALLHQAMEADFQAEKARKLKNFQYLNQYIKVVLHFLHNKSSAQHQIVLIEYDGLSRSRRTLRLFEGRQDLPVRKEL